MANSTHRTPNRLGALSMLSGAGVVLLVWLLFLWVGIPNSLSGLNPVHGFLVQLTTAVPVLLIAAAYLTLARQLWRGGYDDPHD